MKVQRNEVVDYATYAEDIRPAFQKKVLEQKRVRRLHVGEHLTFLFENHDTVLYQVQEMMRVERIVKEADIQHEIDTYNGLLGPKGGLGCTLLIEIDSPEERSVKLSAWLDLNKSLYIETEDGTRVAPTWDDAQVGDTRLSSVQYLHFELGGRAPIAIGCSFDDPSVAAHSVLDDAQRAALRADLQAS